MIVWLFVLFHGYMTTALNIAQKGWIFYTSKKIFGTVVNAASPPNL